MDGLVGSGREVEGLDGEGLRQGLTLGLGLGGGRAWWRV